MTEPTSERGASEPTLPAGHSDQPAWGFSDAAGHVSYELVRVYRPDHVLDPDLPTRKVHSSSNGSGVFAPSTTKRAVGVYLTTSETEARLPPGILEAGKAYVCSLGVFGEDGDARGSATLVTGVIRR